MNTAAGKGIAVIARGAVHTGAAVLARVAALRRTAIALSAGAATEVRVAAAGGSTGLVELANTTATSTRTRGSARVADLAAGTTNTRWAGALGRNTHHLASTCIAGIGRAGVRNLAVVAKEASVGAITGVSAGGICVNAADSAVLAGLNGWITGVAIQAGAIGTRVAGLTGALARVEEIVTSGGVGAAGHRDTLIDVNVAERTSPAGGTFAVNRLDIGSGPHICADRTVGALVGGQNATISFGASVTVGRDAPSEITGAGVVAGGTVVNVGAGTTAAQLRVRGAGARRLAVATENAGGAGTLVTGSRSYVTAHTCVQAGCSATVGVEACSSGPTSRAGTGEVGLSETGDRAGSHTVRHSAGIGFAGVWDTGTNTTIILGRRSCSGFTGRGGGACVDDAIVVLADGGVISAITKHERTLAGDGWKNILLESTDVLDGCEERNLATAAKAGTGLGAGFTRVRGIPLGVLRSSHIETQITLGIEKRASVGVSPLN